MRWTITLEFTPDGGQPLVRQISTISRSMTDVRPEEVGLTLQKGRELRGIERQVIANQVHVYTLCFRCCADCGRRQQFKDVRTKCVQTVFGAYRFRGRRIRTCACQVERGYSASFFPLGFPFHPGRRPKCGSCSPNSVLACPIVRSHACYKICGLGWMRTSRTTIWRHTVALGKAIEQNQLNARRTNTSNLVVAPRTMSVGIDDTYIRRRIPERDLAGGAWLAQPVIGCVRHHDGRRFSARGPARASGRHDAVSRETIHSALQSR